MKDWLGQEYDVGDKVIYAAMSGRSVTMILAEVTEIYRGPKYGYAGYDRELTEEKTETKVKVQPLGSSRWEQHYGRTRYVDERNGKGIDPHRRKHLDGGYWENEVTGERILDEDTYNDSRFYTINRYPYGYQLDGWAHTPSRFKPYVKEVKEGPAPVTLSITENIVKFVSFGNDPDTSLRNDVPVERKG